LPYCKAGTVRGQNTRGLDTASVVFYKSIIMPFAYQPKVWEELSDDASVRLSDLGQKTVRFGHMVTKYE